MRRVSEGIQLGVYCVLDISAVCKYRIVGLVIREGV